MLSLVANQAKKVIVVHINISHLRTPFLVSILVLHTMNFQTVGFQRATLGK